MLEDGRIAIERLLPCAGALQCAMHPLAGRKRQDEASEQRNRPERRGHHARGVQPNRCPQRQKQREHRDLQHDRRYEAALAQTVTFVERAMTDRRDGILLESVEEDGHRRQPRKSGDWKAGYHDVRAAVMLAEAFAPGPAPEPAPEPS